MITDPWFYACAIVAVLIVGIAKGGLGGGIGIVGVPLMSLTIDPIRAAAIMLPILLVMDVFAVRAWWKRWDATNLRTMIPGAVLGTLIGFATFRMLSNDAMRSARRRDRTGDLGRWYIGPPRRRRKARFDAARHVLEHAVRVHQLRHSRRRTADSGVSAVAAARQSHVPGNDRRVFLRRELVEAAVLRVARSARSPICRRRWCSRRLRRSASGSAASLHDRIDESAFYHVVYGSLIVIGVEADLRRRVLTIHQIRTRAELEFAQRRVSRRARSEKCFRTAQRA